MGPLLFSQVEFEHRLVKLFCILPSVLFIHFTEFPLPHLGVVAFVANLFADDFLMNFVQHKKQKMAQNGIVFLVKGLLQVGRFLVELKIFED